MVCKGMMAAAASAIVLSVASFSAPAFALPFNQDMVGKQPVTGTFMRQKPNDTVPTGSLMRRVPPAPEAAKLVNPVPGDELSTINGKRLFQANCEVCHGKWVDGKHVPSALPGIPSMDLTIDLYKGRTDGEIFSAIHYGKGVMPAYGWKFSPQEQWDLVNFVRKTQGLQPK